MLAPGCHRQGTQKNIRSMKSRVCATRGSRAALVLLTLAVAGLAQGHQPEQQGAPTASPGLDAATEDSCYRSIRALALHDAQLGGALLPELSRMWQKWRAGAEAQDSEDFVALMAPQQSQGIDYVCHHTADWVVEVFVGLPTQYQQQYSASTGWPPTWEPSERWGSPAAKRLLGEELVELFEDKALGKGHVLFQLEAGNANRDHEWVVEQLPGGAGYRVYQSYLWAFSLKAWLSPNGTDLEELWASGDIQYRESQVLNWVDGVFLNLTQGACNLSAVASGVCSSEEVNPSLADWAAYLLEWDKQQALEALESAWRRWGQGQVIPPQAFFSEYLPTLSNSMAGFLDLYQGTAAPVTSEYFDSFIQLFGTYDFPAAPGVPLNATEQLIHEPGEEEPFSVFALTYDLPGSTAQLSAACDANAVKLLRSLVPAAADGAG